MEIVVFLPGDILLDTIACKFNDFIILTNHDHIIKCQVMICIVEDKMYSLINW